MSKKTKSRNKISPPVCIYCGRTMQCVNKDIHREDMHMINHLEECSEWECNCGFAAYLGKLTGKLYPFKKIVLK